MSATISAAGEWRRYGTVPVAAALGYSLAVIHVYSLGAFIEPLTKEFGWNRAQASAGLTMTGSVSALAAIPIGLLVDRIGPRRVALAGTVFMGAAFALLGTANGQLSNWLLLWAVLAFATFWVQTTVWTSAVASRFETSRGLALGVTLSGASLAAAFFPPLATAAIEAQGWRNAFFTMGGAWSVLTLVLVFIFFHSAKDHARKATTADMQPAAELPGLSIAEGLRSPAFYKLIAAAGLFTFTALGIVVHLTPMLKDAGADPMRAASIAGLVGVFSIIGRVGTGFLLDHLPGKLVGACAFLLPIIACALLLWNGGDPISQSVAAAIIGLTLGAEVDVIAYLASRHFGLKNFGALFGGMVMALSLGTAFGPLAAGWTFDTFGGYAPFLVMTMAVMGLSSLLLLSLSQPRFAAAGH